MRLLLALALTFLGLVTARGWDDGGHEIVSAIAYATSTPRPRPLSTNSPRSSTARAAPTMLPPSAAGSTTSATIPPSPKTTNSALGTTSTSPSTRAIPRPSFDVGADTPQHGNAVQALKRALTVLQGGHDPYITTSPPRSP